MDWVMVFPVYVTLMIFMGSPYINMCSIYRTNNIREPI